MYEWIQLLHLAAGIVWLGGMTLLLWAVRPAAIALLPPEQRLPLLQRVLARFLCWSGWRLRCFWPLGCGCSAAPT